MFGAANFAGAPAGQTQLWLSGQTALTAKVPTIITSALAFPPCAVTRLVPPAVPFPLSSYIHSSFFQPTNTRDESAWPHLSNQTIKESKDNALVVSPPLSSQFRAFTPRSTRRRRFRAAQGSASIFLRLWSTTPPRAGLPSHRFFPFDTCNAQQQRTTALSGPHVDAPPPSPSCRAQRLIRCSPTRCRQVSCPSLFA